MPRTIKFLGGLALLVSGLTGPSVAVIPLLFQQAGWLTPIIAFVVTTILTGAAALFIVESMASIEGNEDFEASIEFSTIAELFLGPRWRWVIQIILYITLQTQVIISLIESFQSMDALLVTIAHKTCAVSFQKGWECVDEILSDGSGVFSDYIFVSFGYLLTLAVVFPLGLIHLSDNIKFQIASLATLFFIAIVWVATFFQVGITNNVVPVIGSSQATVVGFVISNFAFVTTIPAFVNNTHPSIKIHRVIWLSLAFACILYIVLGWTGASAFEVPENSTILNLIASRRPSRIALISTYLFTPAVLLSSIPVFMIVIRYNLLRGDFCSERWAIFFSSILPWIVVIPFQTRGWIAIILNWSSLLFSSSSNLIIPFLLYLASKRYRASHALDPQRKQDEFRLSFLEASSEETLPSNSISLSPITPRRRGYSRLGRSRSAGHLSVPATSNVIRLVKSPSIHRNYGQRAEEPSPTYASRRHTIIALPHRSHAVEDEGTTHSDDIALEVDGAPKRPKFLTTDGESTPPHRDSLSPTRRVIDVIHEQDESGTTLSDDTIAADMLTPLMSPRVPDATATLSRSRSLSTSGIVDLQKTDGSSIAEERPGSHGGEFTPKKVPPRIKIIDELDPITRTGDTVSFVLPIEQAVDDETPHRIFEAFPTLNKTRWFNSTRVAIISCVFMTLMVLFTIIYTIVQSA